MSDTTGKTRSKVIPGEGETAFQRWELPHLLTANQMERIQKQAYEEGFARGQVDGLKDARTQLDARLAQLASILNSIASPLKELDERAEQELVMLAMSAARPGPGDRGGARGDGGAAGGGTQRTPAPASRRRATSARASEIE
jgi:hypothetical protein